jgi:hypothetical protein
MVVLEVVLVLLLNMPLEEVEAVRVPPLHY